MSGARRAFPGRSWLCAAALVLCLCAGLWAGAASARTLEAIRASGAIKLCAHPNSLPYASKAGDPAGFQVELGRALAARLGVALDTEWIVTPVQIARADCDIVLDTIADPEAQSETHLALSNSYYGSGVAIVVRQGSPITGFGALNGRTKVGVMVGSVAAMMLEQRGVSISMFGFEDDMLAALAAGEIDAAAATPMAAGWFQKTHAAQAPIAILPTGEKALTWNVAVGMRRPDGDLRDAINAALEKLNEDGTTEAIYARYGIALQAPRPMP
jgi:polar amino acid transport system substrate-binding protein